MDMKKEYFALLLFTVLCSIPYCHSDSNGGATCATCGVIFGLAEQTAVIHNTTVVQSMEKLCSYLPIKFEALCRTFVEFIGPILFEILEENDTPDEICHKLGLCFVEKGRSCNLFPMKKEKAKFYHFSEDPILIKKTKHLNTFKLGADICDLPGIKEICNWIKNIFDNHDPAVDLDGDRHSVYETLRGYSWRGKDCNDNKKSIHPGARAINGDIDEDSNCNGIKGKDPSTGKSYETTFCSQSEPRGIAVLGDSISAHFHLPREWFNSTELSIANFEPLPYVGENELDWPALSYGTGFMNATEELSRIIHGHTDSIYLRLWERNRCNFRDYQNIAVNGARASSMVDNIENSLYRNVTGDYPLIVFYALVGNDVCNGHPDTISHMTTPAEMKNYATKTLQYLDANLPAGSYVFMTGLADGRVLYNSLKDKIHPIGSLRNDVTYAHFYDYFNCLEISPCTGWMNTNETLRNLTTKRAMELSAALQEVVNTTGPYKNFKVYYNENPINKVIQQWEAAGKQAWELLEPVDGFHSNQRGNAEIARVIWEELEKEWPETIGKVNPYNEKISSIFGNQGGYR
ncbi:hypothetical protein ACF0H5_005678 [Mactra antiquata]